MKVVVTGSAGFIGAAVALRLLERGDEVLGIDNVNDYYDVNLKLGRLERLKACDAFIEARVNVEDKEALLQIIAKFRPERVIHLAAQAGVRYSIKNPFAYVDTNLVGFINILEACRRNEVAHLVYASSSSVYGANTTMPFSVRDNVNHPLSLYAATKKANELMAHTYSSLYDLPTTGLRFFTVYGPWGRPDMALFLFTKNILAGKPIDVFNYGDHRRDFTYIDDVVAGVAHVADTLPQPDASWRGDTPGCATSFAPYRVYNIGNSRAIELKRYIRVLEDCLGKKAQQNLLPAQPGDVANTLAEVEDLVTATGYKPSTSVEVGIRNFVDWYRQYYAV